jgi:hypothetical protein
MWQTLRYAALFGTFVAWTAAIFFSVRAYEISKTSTEHKPLLPRFVLLATALSSIFFALLWSFIIIGHAVR